MNSWLNRLLDLEQIRLGEDAPVLLRWQGQVPVWLLFCAALAGCLWVGMIYRRERGSRVRRVGLAGLRLAALAWLGLLICQPALVLQRNREERSRVVLLVDTSQSMATTEPYPDEAWVPAVARGADLADPQQLSTHSRLDLARRALLRDDAQPLRAGLARNDLQLTGFAAECHDLAFAQPADGPARVVSALQDLPATGRSTQLAAALLDTLRRGQRQRLAAIVLISDGQATSPAGFAQVAQLARGQQVPIYALRLGSPVQRIDLAVGPVQAEPTAFVKDLLAVEVPVSAAGLTEALRCTVRLTDDATSQTLAEVEQVLTPDEPRAQVELRTQPQQAGERRLRVEVLPQPGEQVLDNNEAVVEVSVIDERVRVLYVEGYPRYEYRYLKNALLREDTIELSVLLLEADPGFVQEGTLPIRRFPESAEELDRYDVVLFGDVDPQPQGRLQAGWLSAAQMELLLRFVGERGGGFGVIAGERAVPLRFHGTPLEKLLPVRIDPQFTGRYVEPITRGYVPVRTPEGAESSLLRFYPTDAESDAALADLPEMYWLARTLGPRAGATPLLVHPSLQTERGPMPVLVVGQYGAGKLLFQATDDTWRWRRHTGEWLHDTYWLRVVRALVQSRQLAAQRWLVRPEQPIYAYGQPVRVYVELRDSRADAELAEVVPMLLRGVDGQVLTRFSAVRLAPGVARFEGVVVPPGAGSFVLEVEVPVTADEPSPPRATVRVDRLELEALQPQADHDRLEQLAEATGGAVLALDELAERLAELPNRSVRTPDDVVEPLWDTRLAWLVLIVLLTTEWGLRKAFGML